MPVPKPAHTHILKKRIKTVEPRTGHRKYHPPRIGSNPYFICDHNIDERQISEAIEKTKMSLCDPSVLKKAAYRQMIGAGCLFHDLPKFAKVNNAPTRNFAPNRFRLTLSVTV